MPLCNVVFWNVFVLSSDLETAV